MRITEVIIDAADPIVVNTAVENRSLWTRAHLAFRLRTNNLVLVAKGT